jgi:PST family polysaccharide transporter
MASGVLGSLVAYFTRIIVIHQLGLQATGQYQAAYTLSSYYVGFILAAMGTGLLPRLAGVCRDHPEVNRMLNQQTEIGLLLASPGIIATLVAAPWVLRLLYTGDFVAATGIIQWQVIGVFFRMLSWPLWHLQLAKGLGRVFACTEAGFAGLQILLNWVCISRWGLDGIGIAFALSYVAHAAGMNLLCRRLSGFAWSRRVFLITLPGLLLLGVSFAAIRLLPVVWGVGLGLGLCLLACLGSFHGLQKLLGLDVRTMILNRFRPNAA